METLWFAIIAGGLTIYVILDGFDIGAGALHLFVARTDTERRTVIRSIGPVWDGNEVWLLAGGGLLVLGFPAVYASAFSGFYLPFMIVLWLLIGRGLSIEYRNHVNSPLWRPFWDLCFGLSSALLAVFLGAALTNIVRGVPLDEGGRFFAPLWTDFAVHTPSLGHTDIGVLDGYTLLGGLTALAVLTLHGATWVVLKTTGAVRDRSRSLCQTGWWVVLVLVLLLSALTFNVQTHVAERMASPGLGWLFPILAAVGLLLVRLHTRAGRELPAFLSSCAFLAGLMGSVAWGLYPYLLPATTDPARGLDIHNAASSPYALSIAIWWLVPGMALAITWFVIVYRSFAGKVDLDDEGY
jgi:cytochrome d ubiquinol oxidase subunit II